MSMQESPASVYAESRLPCVSESKVSCRERPRLLPPRSWPREEHRYCCCWCCCWGFPPRLPWYSLPPHSVPSRFGGSLCARLDPCGESRGEPRAQWPCRDKQCERLVKGNTTLYNTMNTQSSIWLLNKICWLKCWCKHAQNVHKICTKVVKSNQNTLKLLIDATVPPSGSMRSWQQTIDRTLFNSKCKKKKNFLWVVILWGFLFFKYYVSLPSKFFAWLGNILVLKNHIWLKKKKCTWGNTKKEKKWKCVCKMCQIGDFKNEVMINLNFN